MFSSRRCCQLSALVGFLLIHFAYYGRSFERIVQWRHRFCALVVDEGDPTRLCEQVDCILLGSYVRRFYLSQKDCVIFAGTRSVAYFLRKCFFWLLGLNAVVSKIRAVRIAQRVLRVEVDFRHTKGNSTHFREYSSWIKIGLTLQQFRGFAWSRRQT